MEDNNKYYQSRHFLRLLHRYEKAVAEGHMPYLEADELTDIAEYYMTGGQEEKAEGAIQAAIDMHPDAPDPQIFRARQKMFYGKLDEARAITDAITEQQDSEVIYLRAELLIKAGQCAEASLFLEDQMELMQDSMDTYLYDCTAIFMDYDQWQTAKTWLDRLRKHCPEHPSLPIMEAEIMMGLDKYEEALDMLRDIVDADPYCTEAWNLLAETYVALDMFPEAQEAADFALAINPAEADALLMKGNAFMRNEQMKEAIEQYDSYLKLKPDDLGAQISLALCLTSEERHKEVLPLLEKAEKQAKASSDGKTDLLQIFQIRATCMSRLKQTAEALKALREARLICEKEWAWKIDMTEADVYLWAGETEMAEKYFSRALQGSSEQGETLFNIAMSYMGAGYNESAIELLNDVWSIYGTEEGKFVVPYLANCYMRIGDTENFLKFLSMAPTCDREATRYIFRDRFPDIAPEDYYAYAYKEVHGVFPKSR